MAARFLRFELRGPSEPGRSPLLERLLARADTSRISSDWRADAYAALSPGAAMPCVAPLVLWAADAVQAARSQATAWVCLATPVHYIAELSNVRFAGDGVLTLDAAEAAALALDFNRLWSGAGVHLCAAAQRLFCVFESAFDVTTQDPETARGLHLVSFLPTGRDAARLRGVMSEIEMWLFDHAVNQRRRGQSRLPISSLWLWGGGEPLTSQPSVHGRTGGEDVFFDAFASNGERIADVMVVEAVPGSQAWGEVESQWLAPSLHSLRRGHIERLELSGGEQCFTVSARWRWKIWRRAKPWWEYFE